MFEFLKGNETKSLEILDHNKKLVKDSNKRFHYSLNPCILKDHLESQARFIYSCQGLKNYFTKSDVNHDYTLQIESIVFVASMADNLLRDIDYNFFEVGFFIDHIMKESYGNGDVRSYHLDVTRELIHKHIYKKKYSNYTIKSSIKEFLNKTDKLTKENRWNSIIDSYLQKEVENFYFFIKENANEIIDKSKKLDSSTDSQFKEMESKYIDSSHKDTDYKPDLFPYGIVRNINDITDHHLLKQMGISIDHLDLEYYKENLPMFFRSNFIDSPSLAIFRYIVEQAYTVKNGEYQKSTLKLKDGDKTIYGIEVSKYLKDVMFDPEMKPHLGYIL